ncbi:MAG: hypothetical protein JNG85_17890 [Spirochaetaceae bacterium]|nr:hypothetical protein [Spirochaetaceae bacterium]
MTDSNRDSERFAGRPKAAAVVSVIGFLAVVTANALANALPLNGVGTGTLSDEIPNLFVPAGPTFSIWGLIYLLLAGYAVAVIAETFGRRNGAAWKRRDGLFFIVNAAANVAWIFAWHWRQVPLSLGLMLVILGTLIALEERIAPRLAAGGTLAASGGGGRPRLRRFFLSVPIRVYLGWILVATIANVTAVLVKLDWKGFGLYPAIWTILVIAAGLALALFYALGRRAVATPLVVVWAYAGIVIKRTGIDSAESAPVWIAAAVAAGLILLAIAAKRLAPRGRA